MSEIKHIRNAYPPAAKRRGPRAYEAPGSPLFTLIYGLAMLAMVGASLGLGWMINEKQQWVDPKPVLQQIEVLSEKLHLKSLSAWLPFEKWFGKEQPVAAAEPEPAVTVSAPVYVRPVSGAVLTPFSGDTLLFQPTMGDWRVHAGTDFSAEAGETVLALTDGTVQQICRGWPVRHLRDADAY